jgi:hypothetical protein
MLCFTAIEECYMLASQIQALLVESERIHQADGAAGVALAQQALALAEQSISATTPRR